MFFNFYGIRLSVKYNDFLIINNHSKIFHVSILHYKDKLKVQHICCALMLHLCIALFLGRSYRSSHSEVFLGKGVRKICSKFTVEHPCRNSILIKLQSNFIEIALWHGCSPVNLLHIFRTPFLKNTSGWLLPVLLISLNLVYSRYLTLSYFYNRLTSSLNNLRLIRRCKIN